MYCGKKANTTRWQQRQSFKRSFHCERLLKPRCVRPSPWKASGCDNTIAAEHLKTPNPNNWSPRHLICLTAFGSGEASYIARKMMLMAFTVGEEYGFSTVDLLTGEVLPIFHYYGIPHHSQILSDSRSFFKKCFYQRLH